MAETDLNIIMRLQDQATEGMKKIAGNLEDFSRSIKQVGREISQVGSILTMTGAAITGPFALAFKNSAKNVTEVNQAMMGLENTINNLQDTIAKSIVPIVERFSSILNNLYNALMSIDPAMRNCIIQGTFLTGVFLTLGGAITLVVGKMLIWEANLGLLIARFTALTVTIGSFTIPLWIILAAIVAIGAAMFKWKWVADTVLSTFEVLFLTLKNGFIALKAAIEAITIEVMKPILNLLDLLAKVPGPTQAMFRHLADNAREASDAIRNGLNQDLEGIATNAERITNILATGQGQWSQGFDNLKISIQGAWNKLTEGDAKVVQSAATWKKNYEGMKGAVGELSSALAGASEMGRGWARAAQVTAIGMATMNTAQGVTKAFAEYMWPYSMIVAAIIGAAGAIQIATIASQQFATGTDTVPAMVSPGEMIFPRSMADAIRAGDIAVSGRGGLSQQTINHISIEVNNPTIRQDSDIDKLTEEISRRIALEAERI